MSDYSEWLGAIEQKARRFSIVFLQLGAAYEPARRQLIESTSNAVTVVDYLAGNSLSENETVVIDAIESLCDPRADVQLGQLRERVFTDVDAGRRFVLLSRSPRAAFPPVPGSSLLEDASFAHGPQVDGDRFDQVPTCLVDGCEPGETLHNALLELGVEVCASLDRAIFEDMLTGKDALQLFSSRELEALDGAGITWQSDGRRRWQFPKLMTVLKSELSLVLARQLEAQTQLADVTSGLWRIERMLRLAIRLRASAAWGSNWKSQCLNETLTKEVIARATESAYLSATSIKQIRDPLEWLSLGELLGLKDMKPIGDLGMSEALWRQFRAQLMPIRNRLAHMRTLRPDDAAIVIKWLNVVETKVNLTGTLSP